MPEPTKYTPDSEGEEITWQNGTLVVPDVPIIPFIEGDGVGPDIWLASVRVFDAAVKKIFNGQRRVARLEVLAGEKANAEFGEWLPSESIEAIRNY